MRLCRYLAGDKAVVALYDEERLVPLASAAQAYRDATHQALALPDGDNLLDFLPPSGPRLADVRKLHAWVAGQSGNLPRGIATPTEKAELLVPIPRPNKLFLLAGNYADHIREGGGQAAERAETFPYVFMKPPTTTLTDPGKPVRIPAVSPHAIDWELELAVVIGDRVKGVSEGEALKHVAGYTIINDISDRKFTPNPSRKKREKDVFFDWLHGKWADSFCPCGPCVTSADAIPDPQALAMNLKLNGQTKQDASTSQQVFPVAAVIAFLASFVTLEPGDIISTGTPAGVGKSTNTFLKAGDRVTASIEGIGTLASPVIGP